VGWGAKSHGYGCGQRASANFVASFTPILKLAAKFFDQNLFVKKNYVMESSFVWLFAPACVMTGLWLSLLKLHLALLLGE
jgi:hypothetical protein